MIYGNSTEETVCHSYCGQSVSFNPALDLPAASTLAGLRRFFGAGPGLRWRNVPISVVLIGRGNYLGVVKRVKRLSIVSLRDTMEDNH